MGFFLSLKSTFFRYETQKRRFLLVVSYLAFIYVGCSFAPGFRLVASFFLGDATGGRGLATRPADDLYII